MSRRAWAVIPMAQAVALVLGGCGGTAGDAGDPSASDVRGTLTVFAAASLTDVFEDLGARLEDRHPGLDVQFSFAGSSALAAQLEQGAPADVFASADEAQMARVTVADLVADPQVFAGNSLVLAVPSGNPGEIPDPPAQAGPPSLAEFLVDDSLLAVCAPEVPCGRAAAEVLEAAGLSGAPDTYEDDVRAVLTKVRLGEVDAGLVYRSDVTAAGDGAVVHDFAEAGLAVNRYLLAPLAAAPNPAAAGAFVDLVLSTDGVEALLRAGFAVASR